MNILVVGKYGQLASCLRDVVKQEKNTDTGINWHFLPSMQLNIAERKSVQQTFARINPQLVINTAAYTQVDKAEEEQDKAIAVNQLGCKYLAIACANLNIPMIHISTDYVFSGDAQTPYTPGEKTAPGCTYGLSKFLGEQEVMTYLNKFVIIRTAWVFSEYGKNFVRTMLKLAREKQQFGVVNDQVGNPTYAGDLARGIYQIAVAIKGGEKQWGIYHYNGASSVSWYQFAREIVDMAKDKAVIPLLPKIAPLTTLQYPTPAKRPAYSSMCNEKIMRKWRVVPSDWKKGLAKVIENEQQQF
ncbi:dTDP-4-dehydrorhamnose reductase [Thalassotalea litorea]|uniref:dTDP-4-dehydrorhamnose reductase n=1 Tax=Thalassotalea litorea TaxID=2020715 RepID=A0A5R9IH72_9GAMM|nr:dTDP-4-dehydrorhamnose reductase [Thalassotalea litorea]TLU64884.1 dTDP-4-dehydrorhamnose reductase [Thalassotalea litorea]